MKKTLLALIALLGFASPAVAQNDLLSDLFGIGAQVETPIGNASSGVYVHPRHHRYGAYAHIGADPAAVGMVTAVAVEQGVNPALVHAVVRIESGYRCNARNGANAGIMQTSYRTARSMGVAGSLSSCRNGLVAGVRYLRQAIAMHGYGCAAFSAFQSGIGVHRCSSYGRRVMAMMGGASGGYANIGDAASRIVRATHYGHRIAHHHRSLRTAWHRRYAYR